ncbi:UDP-2,4-diacetamido-2,4,6-trideoxy-beta-L-altropyranose hydrolase [Pseudomonas sp. NFACC02]|uniref:UDP-2,4-diacetamido-2,4, 6-trideoxy-beta-L-altropyranose hydrolase n=1 Tax=Pseudomonas sp. NFACC02 TaxID=1566250 RepID=UPI0008C1989A|nr:UDP-2,4-diacetamido-2,4,6-trideoxy-beta-L-altropyranose hydrolase [Pseudomonas sp. NFACC02]SEQ37163.1 UDP-2,4-diacetamido-2,4,6-trideoxy-beta-L-altropyranose hydrolase [Pseudomonas sp. NFACC02]
MRVLIRADASAAIGSGHIARCLTLATALRKDGAEVVFACRQLPGHLLQRLGEHGYLALGLPEHYPQEASGAGIEVLLPWQADIVALASALGNEQRFDWLIVDHYGLDARWERAARRFADRLMAIDDLANRPHAVDLLLDQNYSAQAQDCPYAPWIEGDCKTFLGPRFALLRDEFQCRPIVIKPRVERVMVNFGGFDAACQVYATMLALQGFDDLQVDFVAGLHHPEWAAMSELIKARPNWRLHTLVNDFSGFMQQADLFIGAGGGTTWERAALGLPTICIAVAHNQQLNAQLLAQAGGHLYLGAHDTLDLQRLVDAVAVLRDNRELRQSLAERSRALVDGKGAQRLAVALAAPLLELRLATSRDATLLFQGRNAAHVRRWAFNSDPIDWDSHIDWFERSLSHPRRRILIAETARGPVGMVRYDREGDSVEVSIYLFDGHAGVGWGQVLLSSGERFLRRHWPDIRIIRAQVLADNAVSVSLFQKAGYAQAERHFQRVINDE